MKELLGKELILINGKNECNVFVAGIDELKGITLLEVDTNDEKWCFNRVDESETISIEMLDEIWKWAVLCIESGIMDCKDDPLYKIWPQDITTQLGFQSTCAFK